MSGFCLSRYEQHIELPNVGVEGQEKIHDARVLIVGAGGLGCPASLYLMAAGVGHLGLVDQDVVDESNLQRQVLFGNADVGRKKVDAARGRLMQMENGQTVETYDFFLDCDNADNLISSYDVIIDASDNHLARLAVNEACLRHKKPWVYGALYHFEGQVMAFNGADYSAPCFKCVFSDLDENSNLPTCKSAGILGTVPGVIGCLQATEALKIILGLVRTEDYNRLKIINTLTYDINNIMTIKNENCSVCQKYEK